MDYKKVLCSYICTLGFEETCNEIIVRAKKKMNAYVCFVNVHMLIEAYKDKVFSETVNNAFLAVPDGMPVVKILRRAYQLNQERIAGMDVFPQLLSLAEKNNLSVYFYGTTPDLLNRIEQKSKREFPQIKIAGSLAPPFDKSVNSNEFIEQIKSTKPDLVFVSLGCPKQEKWMFKHTKDINAVLLGVGGAFPIYVGEAKRAPRWIRNLSLEWLYRLFQEPKRLFKRYFITNSLFLYLRFKQFVLKKEIIAK